MTLIAPPALSDHTIWMLHDGREAYGNPEDAAPVQAAPDANGLALSAILVRQCRLHDSMRRTASHISQNGRPMPAVAQPTALPDERAARLAQKCTRFARRSARAAGARNSFRGRSLDTDGTTPGCGVPMLPSTTARERAIPPFLRCTAPGVVHTVPRKGAANDKAPPARGALREWKNQIQ
jgi:hypothetical protein